MSFFGSLSEARANIHDVERSTNIGHSVGKASSGMLRGHSTPGSENLPAGETQQVGRLRKGIKTPKTRTDTLTRKYAASGK